MDEPATICCICKAPIEADGHNAEPIATGKCCDTCNEVVVVPARIAEAFAEKR